MWSFSRVKTILLLVLRKLLSFKIKLLNSKQKAGLPLSSLTPYFVAFCVLLGTAFIFISDISSSETCANRLAAILFLKTKG